jgi:hypothetical protein
VISEAKFGDAAACGQAGARPEHYRTFSEDDNLFIHVRFRLLPSELGL